MEPLVVCHANILFNIYSHCLSALSSLREAQWHKRILGDMVAARGNRFASDIAISTVGIKPTGNLAEVQKTACYYKMIKRDPVLTALGISKSCYSITRI